MKENSVQFQFFDLPVDYSETVIWLFDAAVVYNIVIVKSEHR